MAVAGIIASLKITGKSLRQNVFLFQGAGEVKFYLLSYLAKSGDNCIQNVHMGRYIIEYMV